MKIVKFKDGTYAIRKGWFFYSYASLSATDCWWSLDDSYVVNCKGSLAEVTTSYNELIQTKIDSKDKGTPI